MFALIALVLFALAAFGVRWDEVEIVALGLAFMAAHLLLGSWPLSGIALTRKSK